MRFYSEKIQSELRDKDLVTYFKTRRVRVGDRIILFNGDGYDYNATVESLDQKCVRVDIGDKEENNRECETDVTLYLAVIAKDKFALAAQKATELGVKRIVPVITERSQRIFEVNVERIRKVCISACEQCGRAIIPCVEEAKTLQIALSDIAMYDKFVFAYENEGEKRLRDAGLARGNRIGLFIGAEGGITKNESELLIGGGAIPFTLGRRILRAETAVISALSLIYEKTDEC